MEHKYHSVSFMQQISVLQKSLFFMRLSRKSLKYRKNITIKILINFSIFWRLRNQTYGLFFQNDQFVSCSLSLIHIILSSNIDLIRTHAAC